MNRIGDTVTERIGVLNQCGTLETLKWSKTISNTNYFSMFYYRI